MVVTMTPAEGRDVIQPLIDLPVSVMFATSIGRITQQSEVGPEPIETTVGGIGAERPRERSVFGQ